MADNPSVLSILREKKTLLIIIAIILFLMELEIFALASMKSGRKSWIHVFDTNGNLIYESDGKNLSEFNKYYFEKNFGPLDQYELKLVQKVQPFPFRAWFSAAIGIPVGIVLLFGFVIKAYISFFYADEKEKEKEASVLKQTEFSSPMQKMIAYFSNLNIFVIGFLIFMAIFAYWVIPNFFTYISKVGVDTLIHYKWFFLAVAGVIVGLFIWMVYLKYLLAKKTIESQTEIEKERLQLEFKQDLEAAPQLEFKEETSSPSLVSWEDSEIIDHQAENEMPDNETSETAKTDSESSNSQKTTADNSERSDVTP